MYEITWGDFTFRPEARKLKRKTGAVKIIIRQLNLLQTKQYWTVKLNIYIPEKLALMICFKRELKDYGWAHVWTGYEIMKLSFILSILRENTISQLFFFHNYFGIIAVKYSSVCSISSQSREKNRFCWGMAIFQLDWAMHSKSSHASVDVFQNNLVRKILRSHEVFSIVYK